MSKLPTPALHPPYDNESHNSPTTPLSVTPFRGISSVTPFSIISSSKLIGFPDGNIISWCPTMDLLAISMNKMSIWAFRLNGERIYSINNKSIILSIEWHPNGKFFVVSGIDKSIKIYDSNNGKYLKTITNSLGLSIGLINWTIINIEKFNEFDLGKVNILQYLPKLQYEIEINDLITNNNNTNNGYIENNPIQEDENFLNFILTINSNATLSITFNNLFTINDIDLPEDFKFIDHVIINNNLFNQFFLVENNDNQLNLIRLKLCLSPDHINPNDNIKNEKYFIDIINNCSKMISLINHINDQFSGLTIECKSFISLFDRNLSNFKDSIYSTTDLTTEFPTPKQLEIKMLNSLYDILLTNLIPKNCKDFWLNQLGERGLKRLNKIGNSLYDLIRKTIFTQIISALEKLIIILNDLQGLSKWFIDNHDSKGFYYKEFESDDEKFKFGLEYNLILKLINYCQNLIKLFYKLIWEINEEQKFFNKFLNWCKIEIVDKLFYEDNDVENFFNTNSNQTFKNSEILQYLNEYLFHSKIFDYFNVDCSMNEVLLFDTIIEEKNILFNFNKLNSKFNEQFLHNIIEFFTSIIIFDNPINLDLPKLSKSAKLKNSKSPNELIISSIIETENSNQISSSLYLTKFNTESLEIEKGTIEFPLNEIAPIINYDFVSFDRLIILYQILDLRKLVLFKFDNYFNNTTGYDSIQIIKSMTFDQVSHISNPKYLAVNGNESRSIGFVLDDNRQKYVIFKL